MDRGAAMYEFKMENQFFGSQRRRKLADALTGGIGLDNKHTFELTKELVDDFCISKREGNRRGHFTMLIGMSPRY